ncbi:glycosyl transferase family protein [Sphingomonas sp.]|uniref:glycosyl transferase family protein n=1 Tax=Sphingomonas sp. TaxID=28214 RepID=UPI0035C81651
MYLSGDTLGLKGDVGVGALVWLVDACLREALLFAGAGFLVGGIDDLAIDLMWLRGRIVARFAAPPSIDTLPRADPPLRLAIFVPAWREDRVIGAMLRSALGRIRHADYAIYVGAYPNDPATIAAVEAVDDPRVRLVIGPVPGPTTKAGNLNAMWSALRSDDAAAGRATDALILHDAEDVVDADELRIHDALLRSHVAVQVPVVPLIDPAHRLVSGHYADEFAESHSKNLIIRADLGHGLPLAGVGCAIRCEVLAMLGGQTPFDPGSLTEDYELGLKLGASGHAVAFARYRNLGGRLIATRAYFPSRISTAVRQKARWMVGIALAGWDRTGWSRGLAWRDHWMRMRDRRAPLAVLVLAAAYLALVAWGLSLVLHALVGTPVPPLGPALRRLTMVNTALLAWRLAMRIAMTSGLYGWREGARAIPRLLVANYISLLAVSKALRRYLGTLRGTPVRWDKTEHVFPAEAMLAEAP